jgi:hypothetical protein
MPNQPIDWTVTPATVDVRQAPGTPADGAGLQLAGFPGAAFPNRATVEQAALRQPEGLIYHSWGCQSEYVWDYGYRGSPLAAPRRSKKVAVWRVHTGMCYRVVTWAAQSFNGQPPLPKAQTGSANELLLGKSIVGPSPSRMPAGDPLWTFAGQYVYLLQQWPDDDEPLALSSSPLAVEPAAAHVLSPGQFTEIINTLAPNGFDGVRIQF